MSILKVTAWSPSRFAKYKECPRKVLYEDIEKRCPVCFKGRVSGGFDGKPVTCDTCDKPQPEREALDRGNRLDAALTLHLQGSTREATAQNLLAAGIKPGSPEADEHGASLDEAVRHPKIEAMAKKLRKTKGVFTQAEIAVDRAWKRVEWFSKQAWGRVKLDVLKLTPKRAEIIDWKSGNIDKNKGEIREKAEYHDSMRLYQITVLSTHPQAEASATMVFLDAPPKMPDPTKSLPVLLRKDLARAREEMEKKMLPMMSDTIFAPRPGYYCSWCDFSKRVGGPCPH
jgi:hypothetical protein